MIELYKEITRDILSFFVFVIFELFTLFTVAIIISSVFKVIIEYIYDQKFKLQLKMMELMSQSIALQNKKDE